MKFEVNNDNDNPFEAHTNYQKLLAEKKVDKDSVHVDESEFSNLPKSSEISNIKGKEEGQVQLAKNVDDETEILVFKWSMNTNSWNKVGKIPASGLNEKSGGTIGEKRYKGQNYDYLFDVELDDKSRLKLPYNNGQNPYEAAHAFIDDNELPETYLEEIVDFIVANSNYKKIAKQYKFFPHKTLLHYSEGNRQKICDKMDSFYSNSEIGVSGQSLGDEEFNEVTVDKLFVIINSLPEGNYLSIGLFIRRYVF